ncbi:S9 family peptidase [Shouchella hunanensis]|uniref:S9 family peptidase n=1 Tax=Shouchella hunanensis TaxID=766894 RepID=A0ABY7W948_9BACI|nr:S9 family peptidase [Shouchella hunanensis]WDF05166.1 S9 family peptidase [Shouchella hunanensis]
MQLTDFLKVDTATNPHFHPHHLTKLVYLNNATGLPQAYEYDIESQQTTRLVETSERMMLATYIENDLLIGMDYGVNEKQQLYLWKHKEDLVPLTNDPSHIHHFGGVSPNKEWIAWSSNRRHEQFFDVYIQHVSTLAIQCVYEDDARHDPVCFHPDGHHLLIKKTNTNLDNDLGLLHLETKEIEWLTPHDNEASFTDAAFSHDGKFLYLLTNVGREYSGIARLHLQSKELEWLYTGNWDYEALTLSHDGTYMAYAVNEGGVSHAYLTHLPSQTEKKLPIKTGVVTSFTFSNDVTQLVFSLDGAANPAALWCYHLEEQTVTKLENSTRKHTVQEILREPEQLSFTSSDGETIPSFYYKPDGNGPYPTVIFVHGGPESQIRSVYNPFLQYFVSKGFAVCTPNVRGSTGYGKRYHHLDDKRKRMDAVRDLHELAEWLKTEGFAHPDKIAVMGRSYGGFMVLAAITRYPTQWAAAIDIVGISSFKSFLENTSIWRRKVREDEYGSLEEDRDFFDAIDPIHKVDDIKAPLLVLHGRNDPRVPISEAEQIVEQLKHRHHPVDSLYFENEGHFFVRYENNVAAYEKSFAFLTEWL